MFYGMQDILKSSVGISSSATDLREDEFWAINDISFEVQKGEMVGIIGPNGSGKTTLLKMLNGIFWPDRGSITVKGKVGALIAVGAGFHPMLTGRENIYINGAIMELSKKEINERFNDIVAFADIGDFLDMPVKHYSSGMFIRLGFAVAVYCESDILLVDEVLSVGDLSFQNKSLRRLDEIRQKAHAVIIVSHNLEHVRNLCDKLILMDAGKIVFMGNTHEALLNYYDLMTRKKISASEQNCSLHEGFHHSSGDIRFTVSGVMDQFGKKTKRVRMGEPITVFFEFETLKDFEELYFTVGIQNERRQNCITHMSNDPDNDLNFHNNCKGRYRLRVTFKTPNLVPGLYFPLLAIRNGITNETYERVRDLDPFSIEGDIMPRGIVLTESEWDFEQVGGNKRFS
jgi:lipopolysaccharide transport system ATP-binding protein